jgi:hypothetical protein
MVFVDAARARARLYPELIKNSQLLWPRLKKAACGAVRICDATSFVDPTPVIPNSIKAGEAALAIDPLSSQGVQAAVGTALHAAVVINTIIDRPGETELAMDFYRKRLKDSADYHARAAGQFYRGQFNVCPNDFWRKRALAEDLETASKRTPPIHPDIRVRVSDNVRMISVGAVNGSYVVREEGVELNGKASAYLAGARIADLLRVLTSSMTMKELVECWSRTMSRAQALEVLRWVWAEGFLVRAA